MSQRVGHPLQVGIPLECRRRLEKESIDPRDLPQRTQSLLGIHARKVVVRTVGQAYPLLQSGVNLSALHLDPTALSYP